MKKLLLIAVAAGLANNLSAQSLLTGKMAEKVLSSASVVRYTKRANAPAFIQLKPQEQVAYADFNSWVRTALKMGPLDGLQLVKTETDRLGMVHYRYQQTFNGIPVEWATYIVHTKGGKIVSMNGDFHNSIAVDNTLSLTENTSKTLVLQKMGIQKLMVDVPGYQDDLREHMKDPSLSIAPKGNVMILPVGEGESRSFKYVYHFDIFSAEPYGRWDVYIDAATSEILGQYTLIHATEKEGIAKTKYSGERAMTADSLTSGADAGKFRLYGTHSGVVVHTQNLQNRPENNLSSAIEFLDDDNYWNNVNANYDEVGGDAQWAGQMIIDYYKTYQNRNSYNDAGGDLNFYVHANDKNYFNANWNGFRAVFGDGGGKPLVSLDIVGHEITHGVTGNSARLVYARESGGLNESFSDVFGNTIEYYSKPDQFNWKVGEGGTALRDMSNPKSYGNPNTYEGQHWVEAGPGCVPGQGNDNCGVHTNSGVQNKWYQLLVDGGSGTNDKQDAYTVTGIGFEKAGSIAYRNLSVYLVQNSDYEDAYYYSLVSAADLFGGGSQEVVSTADAWYGVGIGEKWTAAPVAAFSIPQQKCAANSTITFDNTSTGALSFEWNFGDGETSDSREPSHKYTAVGEYTVTLIAYRDSLSDTLVANKIVRIYPTNPRKVACSPTASSPQGTVGVLRLVLNDIDNTSVGAKETQYEDFTCKRTLLVSGQLYPIQLTTNNIEQYTRVWIDWNDNGDFSEEGELVMSTRGVTNHVDTIVVPPTAVKGSPLRMRATAARPSGNPTPDDACAALKNGQYEEYTVFVNGFVGINNTAKAANFFNIAPNPSNGTVTVTLDNNSSNNKVSLFNVLGETVYTDVLNNTSATYNWNNLPKGIYYLRISNGKENQTSKIVIE